jgi:hypothetical protein
MNADDGQPGEATPPEPQYLTVEQCRATLPIKISRRQVVNYIKKAGPDYYLEHRRQLFLTPEQWRAVVALTMRPGGPRRARKVKLSPPSAVPEPPDKAFERVQALIAKMERERKDRQRSGG